MFVRVFISGDIGRFLGVLPLTCPTFALLIKQSFAGFAIDVSTLVSFLQAQLPTVCAKSSPTAAFFGSLGSYASTGSKKQRVGLVRGRTELSTNCVNNGRILQLNLASTLSSIAVPEFSAQNPARSAIN